MERFSKTDDLQMLISQRYGKALVENSEDGEFVGLPRKVSKHALEKTVKYHHKRASSPTPFHVFLGERPQV